MPKVVGNANTVYTNASRNLTELKYHAFHCKTCKSYFMITDINLDHLPQRRTDGAYVIGASKGVVKLRTEPAQEATKIRRLKGIETQYRHMCKDCKSVVAYQSVPHDRERELLYLVPHNVLLPKRKAQPAFQCRICGFVTTSSDRFESHKKGRGHQDQEAGPAPKLEDADAPMPPLIVG